MSEPEVLPSSSRTEVSRVGDVLHKSSGPWSRSVHALLRHYETVGFSGAPRVAGDGFDEQGRETVTFIPGEFVHPHVWTDDGIAALGTLLRSLHDAGSALNRRPTRSGSSGSPGPPQRMPSSDTAMSVRGTSSPGRVFLSPLSTGSSPVPSTASTKLHTRGGSTRSCTATTLRHL